jgi:hypothetical protein
MNLNIIGNGFDLYHGLPSSYYYFSCYLIKTDYEFYEQICEMYNLNYRKIYASYPDLEFDYVVEDIFWSNFEACLGNVNENFIVDTHDVDQGLEINEGYELQMDEDKLADKLQDAFNKWVAETLDKNENYLIIKKYLYSNMSANINHDDKFLVFNYTHTLQSLYSVRNDQILYVHGESKRKKPELIVGHGNISRITELEKIISNLYNEPYSQSNKNKMDEYSCLLRYVSKLKKDVELGKLLCDIFYNHITEKPDYINVYGLSYGKVDLPYLMQIKNRWPDVKWRFSYYRDEDYEKGEEVAISTLKLKKGQYELFNFVNPSSNIIINEIEKIQNIEIYKKLV